MANWWPVHGDDEIAAVERVLRSGKTNYYTGTEGREFEREWAAYTGARHALTVSNGTTALEIAIGSLRLPPGSEVIVPCRTFVATASACVTVGLRPVLADIDRRTLNVTVETLKAARTDATRAVVVVHYAGQPCDMESICEWAWDRGIRVVEDCAHAHGARIGDRHVGTFGDAGCFSMCVGKIMSTGGEGGMVVTENSTLFKRMIQRRDHGRFQMVGNPEVRGFDYTVDVTGTNARMTEMQSAVARVQLRKLDGWIARRRAIARMYDEAFGKRAIGTAPGHSYYLYLLRVQDFQKKALLEDERTWSAGVRYGGCGNIGREKAFAGASGAVCREGDLSDREVVSLPVYPTMTDEDVEKVIEAVKAVL